ncbi:ABC transporter substrate-binding protein [Paenibacillus thalictri]|nr:ABC transporter substrate-binding protein [Paenibacillus thalictri]
MKLLEHYEALYGKLAPERLHISIPVTADQLAGLLCCTQRNVKLLMRGMSEAGWIAWQPGLGRGNGSQLAFLMTPQQVLALQAHRYLDAGREAEALALIKSGRLGREETEKVMLHLAGSFGYRVENVSERRIETLRVPSYRSVGMLDPAFVTRRTELHLIRQLFDTLVEFDRRQQRFVPALAHHWEHSRNADKWIFYLHKHAPFHSGGWVTSADVEATILRLQSGASPYRALFAHIRNISLIHDYELELELDAEDRRLLSRLASTAASIVPGRLYGRSAAVPGSDVPPSGTGPFRVVRHDEHHLVLGAFNEYYSRRPQLDRVELWCLPALYENMAAEAELEQHNVNLQHYPYASRQERGWREQRQIDHGCKYMTLNASNCGPLASLKLRRHIAGALDLRRLLLELGGNRGAEAGSLVSYASGKAPASAAKDCLSALAPLVSADFGPAMTAVGGASPDDVRLPVPAKPQSAGRRPETWPGAMEEPLTLRMYTYKGAGNERDAAWLKNELAAAGIGLDIHFIPYEELYLPETMDKADMLLLEQPVDEDAEWALMAQFDNPGSAVCRHAPADLRARRRSSLSAIGTNASRQERMDAYRHWEAELIQACSLLPLYRWQQFIHYPQELNGAAISSLGWVDYKRLWFASRVLEDAGEVQSN